MTDYKQISEKYSDAVKQRKKEIALAEYKIERIKTNLSFYREQREQYRQTCEGYSSYKARMWSSYSSKLRKLEKDLSDAETNLAKINLGTKSVNDILVNIN